MPTTAEVLSTYTQAVELVRASYLRVKSKVRPLHIALNTYAVVATLALPVLFVGAVSSAMILNACLLLGLGTISVILARTTVEDFNPVVPEDVLTALDALPLRQLLNAEEYLQAREQGFVTFRDLKSFLQGQADPVALALAR